MKAKIAEAYASIKPHVSEAYTAMTVLAYDMVTEYAKEVWYELIAPAIHDFTAPREE